MMIHSPFGAHHRWLIRWSPMWCRWVISPPFNGPKYHFATGAEAIAAFVAGEPSEVVE